MKICEKKIEVVCDCGASVPCRRPLSHDELEQTHKLDPTPCLTKLRAANGLPIEIKGVVRVLVVIGPKSYVHDFCVVQKSEADCLLGLDFLESNNCDQLFFCILQMDSHSFVPICHKQFEDGHDNVFRVISTETLSVPSGHTRIFLVHIPNWKRPSIQVCTQFEPKDKFKPNNEVSAPTIFF